MTESESPGAVAAPGASEIDELGRHVISQTSCQPQLTQPPICATPNSSVSCEAESTVARDHIPSAKLASDQRRSDATNAQEFHQIQQFVAECRRLWPGAIIVLRPDGAPTSGAGAPTTTNPTTRFGVDFAFHSLPATAWRTAAKRSDMSALWRNQMDMRRFSGEHFIKVDDVRDGPIQEKIAVVRQGKYDKPDLVFESGDVLSLNATNNKTLMRAYGRNSDDWIGKEVELFLGEIEYQGKMQEAVLVRQISPQVKAKEQTKLKQATGGGKPFDDSSEIQF
jgi:hypothetical protein